MAKEKIKVYTYTRESTAMQIDGYSLDAQKSRMKAFAEFNDYEIAHEYEDAGKSGKLIEGRTQFNQMMEDIKTGKDGVSFVLVFKLSRFGRNAADVLSTLQVMQDFGVNLICLEDGIDSSKDAGKLMISVLSAVAEIERENIRVQTMEGRIQKAREGKWNGGFAPYGYKLVDGKLEINEEEAPAIRTIYEQYVITDSGANGIAKYLENHGISKVQRQNGKNPLFDARLIRMILKNPVYCGKIAYGRRKTEKVHGTRNEYRLVEQENFLLVDGLHEAIIPEDVWQAAQVKIAAQAKRYEHVNKGKSECTHLLSGIVKCPICGVGMYGNKCVKRKADGSKYKDFYYYGCKHRSMTRGHKCDYKKQIRKELLDDAVAEVICKLVSNPKFAAMMREKINMKVDTTAIEQGISNYEKQLRQAYSTKSKLIEEIDALDPDDRHYSRRKSDLDDRLYGMYDKIEELESLLIAARAKKQAIEAEKLTGDNIYTVLICFDQLYGKMNDREKRQLIEELISEIQIYPERQPNGQWLKSIKFRLPIIEEDMNISLDNEQQVEECTVPPGTVHPLEQTLIHTGHQLLDDHVDACHISVRHRTENMTCTVAQAGRRFVVLDGMTDVLTAVGMAPGGDAAVKMFAVQPADKVHIGIAERMGQFAIAAEKQRQQGQQFCLGHAGQQTAQRSAVLRQYTRHPRTPGQAHGAVAADGCLFGPMNVPKARFVREKAAECFAECISETLVYRLIDGVQQHVGGLGNDGVQITFGLLFAALVAAGVVQRFETEKLFAQRRVVFLAFTVGPSGGEMAVIQ